MIEKSWNNFNESPLLVTEEDLNLNHNEKQLSPECTEPGKIAKVGPVPGNKTREQYAHGRYSKYTIVKSRYEYKLQRCGHTLFSSKSKEKLEDMFNDIIKNNGGFLSTSLKSRT